MRKRPEGECLGNGKQIGTAGERPLSRPDGRESAKFSRKGTVSGVANRSLVTKTTVNDMNVFILSGGGEMQTRDRRTNVSQNPSEHVIEVFFDGDCPLCRREIGMLQRWDRHQRIRFTDIAKDDFDAVAIGITQEELMAEIHARLPDGRWLRGVEVFRRLYSAVGFGPLVLLSRCPGISHLLNAGYRVFARNRLKWTGRCTSACDVRNRV